MAELIEMFYIFGSFLVVVHGGGGGGGNALHIWVIFSGG